MPCTSPPDGAEACRTRNHQKRKGEVFMYQVDLNSDLGEGFGAYTIGLD